MELPEEDILSPPLNLSLLCSPQEDIGRIEVLKTNRFVRNKWFLSDNIEIIADSFPAHQNASCCFLRVFSSRKGQIQFIAEGIREVRSCAAGGWLLEASDSHLPSYWIPTLPSTRTLDEKGRILSEEPASISGLRAYGQNLSVSVETKEARYLDWLCWCIPAAKGRILGELEHLLVLETQPVYFWSSRDGYRMPADLYRYLIHGHFYQANFAWPRKWKIFCELDAYELYVTLSGLQLATSKALYSLLKTQILFSVAARLANDGGWYHGEWTDFLESHYRYDTGGTLLLETALEERSNDTVLEALNKAVAFISKRTDATDHGLWFLHDSLEGCVELMDEMVRQTKGFGKWKPSRILGKDPTNKLVLNTHVDTTISLDRYRSITNDAQFDQEIESARDAIRSLLSLRPAETMYRVLYWAIGLTLLPDAEARKLALPKKVIKRVTANSIIPRLYQIKWAFPRFVMPGGLIERHLSALHFGTKYHAVNLLDLARFYRRFPDDYLVPILDGAVAFVVDNKMLRYWSEKKPQQWAIVVYTDALYQLCVLFKTSRPDYRRFLGEAMIRLEDLQLGMPASLLGANSEAVERPRQLACPSVSDPRLRVANLSCADHKELLVVNPTTSSLPLAWEKGPVGDLAWTNSDGQFLQGNATTIHIPARGWLWGRQHDAE